MTKISSGPQSEKGEPKTATKDENCTTGAMIQLAFWKILPNYSTTLALKHIPRFMDTEDQKK